MRVENQTSSPVDYEQSGSGGDPQEEFAESTKGQLGPGEFAEFPPSGKPPFQVTFTFPQGAEKPDRVASVGEILKDEATVVLTAFPIVVEQT